MDRRIIRTMPSGEWEGQGVVASAPACFAFLFDNRFVDANAFLRIKDDWWLALQVSGACIPPAVSGEGRRGASDSESVAGPVDQACR